MADREYYTGYAVFYRMSGRWTVSLFDDPPTYGDSKFWRVKIPIPAALMGEGTLPAKVEDVDEIGQPLAMPTADGGPLEERSRS